MTWLLVTTSPDDVTIMPDPSTSSVSVSPNPLPNGLSVTVICDVIDTTAGSTEAAIDATLLDLSLARLTDPATRTAWLVGAALPLSEVTTAPPMPPPASAAGAAGGTGP